MNASAVSKTIRNFADICVHANDYFDYCKHLILCLAEYFLKRKRNPSRFFGDISWYIAIEENGMLMYNLHHLKIWAILVTSNHRTES